MYILNPLLDILVISGNVLSENFIRKFQ